MRLESIRRAFRHGVVVQTLLERLANLGISVRIRYLVAEGDFHPEVGWAAQFSDFESGELGPDDMPEMARLWPWVPPTKLQERLQAGHICIGLRHQGALAAWTWVDPHACFQGPEPFPLAAGEAYLYDARTVDAFRGRNLAPFMRERCYAALRARGITRFYSHTDYCNTPAVRFKQKLHARPLKLFLDLRVRRWRRYWTLKSWPDRSGTGVA